MSRAFVVGAGAVGEAIALRLRDDGWSVAALMHHRREDARQRLLTAGVDVVDGDIATGTAWAEAGAGADVWILTPRLDISAAALARLQTAPRLIVFSSNNVAVHPEAPSYRALAEAESHLRARFADLAIIRPTMIYGDPCLPTMTRVLRIAEQWPLIPVPGEGRVQPVFHQDLAHLAAGLAANHDSGVYAAGGPDIVTMRDLFAVARETSGGRGALITIPGFALRAGALLMSSRHVLSGEQAARADRNRIAVPQTPLPPELTPRVRLEDGLARLWAAMRAQSA